MYKKYSRLNKKLLISLLFLLTIIFSFDINKNGVLADENTCGDDWWENLDVKLSQFPNIKITDYSDTETDTNGNTKPKTYTTPFWVPFLSSNNSKCTTENPYRDYNENKYTPSLHDEGHDKGHDITRINAFCLDPDNHTPTILKNKTESEHTEQHYMVEASSVDTTMKVSSEYGSYKYDNPDITKRQVATIRRLLYYGIGGPAFSKDAYNNIWVPAINDRNVCPTLNESNDFTYWNTLP